MARKGKIEKSSNLLHADRILREVRKVWPKEWEGWLKCWSNGREQGYWLQAQILDDERFGRAACVFSEGRNCDGALVVVGPPDEFDYQTNHPSAELWEDSECRRYFYDTSGLDQKWTPALRGRGDRNAAEWIVVRLTKLLRDDIKRNAEAREERSRVEAAVGSAR
jgi:hypothetical protein